MLSSRLGRTRLPGERPILSNDGPERGEIELEVVTRQQLLDTLIKSAPAQSVAVVQPFVQGVLVAARWLRAQSHDAFDLGREGQAIRVEPIVKRFYSEAVAHQPEFLQSPIVQSKREHSIEFGKRGHAGLRKKAQNDFRV